MTKIRAQNLILLSVLGLSACAHSNIQLEDNWPAPSEAFQSRDPEQETIAIVAINDFHGNLLPKERKLPDGRIVKSGGAATLTSMVKILREELPGRVAIIDAGDEWQGTLESNPNQGENMIEFYRKLGVNAAAIGNHEFDFGLPNMLKQIGSASYPYLATNIFEKKNSKLPKWRNVFPSHFINVGPYRLGLIGVSTQQTPSTTRYETVAHLNFKEASSAVKAQAHLQRSKGANLILITAHAGTVCEDKLGLKSWRLWSETTPVSACQADGEIVELAEKLAPGEVDGIIAGHTHQVIHHFIRGMPVVQDESYNQYFNIIYFTFDRETKALIPSLTRIEGLIPICAEFLGNQSHCDVRRLGATESPVLTQASFHGQEIVPDAEIDQWLKPIEAATEKFRKEVVGISELPLTHFRDKESAFVNLMADVLKAEGKTDFSLVNSGGIRTSLDAGPITYDGIFRALPFDNQLNVIRLKGSRLKLLYQIASAGAHGIIGFSGLKLTLVPYDSEVPRTDLNGDGKLERWEGKRMVKIETTSGKPIDDEKIYTVATYDFLATGGDDLFWFMSQVPKKDILRPHGGYSRDMAAAYLRQLKVINTAAHPLVDPKNPRVIFTR